ncbi:DUF4348 domain-containing protein [Flavobacterium jejuense]|uniref:DUF4348 domain-containing protein n=1 Tax=Flavobacterium jejuense TaxID=1544455 RepID=A0ABX0IWS7_9FLAO|nr:DUF4348 domain-containing protein [Flavobacterium jejuense]NHN26259.1 DUF4348 domain-containing protein [Flavobacterium jejuense]
MINNFKNKTVLSRLTKQFVFVMSFFTYFLTISCKNENVKEAVKETETKNKSNIEVEYKEVEPKIEEEFSNFIEKFSKDSIFQISRIHFPLTIQLLDDDFELVDFSIVKGDYLMLTFMYPSDFVEFKQKTVVDENDAFIEVRGTGNGIMIDYFFEKINGKWQLKTWVDKST